EQLLTLPDQEAEQRAAAGLRQEQGEERAASAGAQTDGTLGQQIIQATRAAEQNQIATAPAASASAGSPATGTAHWLKTAWLNIIDSFGLTLIYINLHVFGHSVFGEKIFCQLGEEWLPNNLRSNLESPEAQRVIGTIGLLEKMLLIFADLIVLIALILLVAVIIKILDTISQLSAVSKIIKSLTVIGQFLP
ncbi:MAG TPA: hypothetical protein VMD74_00725, partial [Candidatus Methylomirabilis sp.]|nr:hypothetical protein [Candidatus Methylomirabilis sp.]